MRIKWMSLLVVLMIALVGCSPAGSGAAGVGSADPAEGQATDGVRLDDHYDDALTVQGQLAAGTLLLEDTDLAVNEVLAAELLPLWQAVRSLRNSDTAAAVEIEAVLNQIQDTMSAEQIVAIAEMQLTAGELTAMLEDGTLSFGGGGFGRGLGEEGEAGGPGRGFPGGGFPGGRPSGGGPPGDGLGVPGGGAFPQGLDPEAIATRQAEFASGDAGSFQERAMTGAVVRLLGIKTGEIAADQPVRIFEVVFNVVAEATGLSIEEVQAQTAEGSTLAEIVEAHSGDMDSVRAALVDALGELPNAADMDVEQLASQWLGLEQ